VQGQQSTQIVNIWHHIKNTIQLDFRKALKMEQK